MGDILFFIMLVLLLVGPFVLFKVWWWAVTMGVVTLVVIAAEALAVWRTGKTLSQKFWKFSEANRVRALVIIGSLSLGWAVLMLHLAWKIKKGG